MVVIELCPNLSPQSSPGWILPILWAWHSKSPVQYSTPPIGVPVVYKYLLIIVKFARLSTMHPGSLCILFLGLSVALANEKCLASSHDCPNSSSGEKSSHLLHENAEPCYSSCIKKGMYCREENDEIRCTKAKNCDQLTCEKDKGEICSET